MKVSIVVPVHNEARTIEAVLDELAHVPIDKEIIVVDDASTDDSAERIHRHVSVGIAARLHVNQGKGAAVRYGMAHATGSILVVQDADLELSPSVITALVEPIRLGRADAVYGSRFLEGRGNVRLSRWLVNRLLTRLTNRVFGSRLSDMETAHKAFRSEYLPMLELESDGYEIELELTAKLVRLGARIVEIPSPYKPRSRDEGKKIGWRDGVTTLRAFWRWRRWAPASSLLADHVRNAGRSIDAPAPQPEVPQADSGK